MIAAPKRPLRERLARRSLLGLAALAGLALLLPACEWDGHFTVLGYTTKPNYDCNIKTIRVPIFRNNTYWTVTPVPGLEMDLTRAVVAAIEQRTPYKVKQDGADTELIGAILAFTKAPLSVNQFNYPREIETTLSVDLIWRDLRTGEVLSKASRRPGQPVPLDRAPALLGSDPPVSPGTRPFLTPSMPTLPSVDSSPAVTGPENLMIGPDGKPIVPVNIRSVGHFYSELGGSLTTAQKENIDRMAIRITEVMEKGW